MARDASLGRDVALKELRPEGTSQPTIWARFLKEAQITGQLQHPGVVPIYEMGRRPEDQSPFYTMRFVRGRTLAEAAAAYHERLDRGAAGPLALRELVNAFVGVCNAVAYAHSRGVMHRDLKPQNVVLGDYGEVIVLDWGLARLMDQAEPDGEEVAAQLPVSASTEAEATVQGQVLGTPAYMAPEQAEGRLDQLGPATDTYGLGAILYEILTGRSPFTGSKSLDVLNRVVHELPAPPRSLSAGVPRALEAVCLKALAKKVPERYGTAKELAADVEFWLADEPVSAFREPWHMRARRWVKRHRLLVTGGAAAGLVALVGLGAVLSLEARANRTLTAKNAELAEANQKVQARFELAQKAIAMFHTGVSEDMLLKNDQFKELRTKLLREAAGFYADLEKLLAGQTDAKSRRSLADGYNHLGELTEKIGSQLEALTVHRQALAIRRELAAAPGADVETRLDVARSLRSVGIVLYRTGDKAGALAAWEEQRDLAERLEAESPTEAIRVVLAQSHNSIAVLLRNLGKLGAAQESNQKALAIRQKLADANPTVTEFQREVANSHYNVGSLLSQLGKSAEALASYEKALAIRQKLADANPSVSDFQSFLADSHHNIGVFLAMTGELRGALEHFEKERAISQKLADANPAVTEFQISLAGSHNAMGYILAKIWKPGEALASYEQALAICQKLADANPTVALLQRNAAMNHNEIGRLHAREKRFPEAFAALDRGLSILEKLTRDQPTGPDVVAHLGNSHAYRGWARAHTGQPAEAAGDLRRAAELWAKDDAALEIEMRFERSRALALLAGLGGNAQSGVKAAEATAFADQAMDALRDAVHAGWAQLDELKEPDFDPLRGRKDFKKLVAELEAKAKVRDKWGR